MLRSRATLSAPILAAMLTATLTAGVGAASSAAEPSPASDTTEAAPVRVGTYNIRAGVDTDTFERVVTELMPHADVIGLQEINSKDKAAVLAGLSAQGWDYYRPHRFDGEQNPVMWNTDRFSLLSAESIKTAEETYLGDELPVKGSTMDAHFVSVVRLRDLSTDEAITIINIHLPPGAIKAGRPVPGRPTLYNRYVTELAATAKIAASEGEAVRVFTLGDYNVGWVADARWRLKRLPIRRFNRKDMVSMWATELPDGKVGTHNDALIDQIYSQQEATSATVLNTIVGSDHYPAVATYPAA